MNIPILTERTCKNCRFSVAAPSNASMRECHYGPPTANAVMLPDGKGGIHVAGVISVWPQLRNEMSCHRFERGISIKIADARALA